MTLWIWTAVCSALLAAAPPGSDRGAAPVIAVVSPAQLDRAMSEALNRFRGEAAAVGFVVTIVPASKGAPSAQMESAARAVPGLATVAFVRGGDPTELDVWFTDRSDGQTIVDHVSVDSNRADRAVVLAVKAVDVLRARMFGLLARRGHPRGGAHAEPVPGAVLGGPATSTSSSPNLAEASPPSRDLPTPAREPVPAREQMVAVGEQAPSDQPPTRRPAPTPVAATVDAHPTTESTVPPFGSGSGGALGMGLGVGMLRSLPGVGASFLLVLRGEYDFTRRSAARLMFGGFGTRPVLEAPAGRALVRDTLLMVEWGLQPWQSRVRPVFAVGLGFHYFSADGSVMQPFRGSTVGRLVGAAGISLGLRGIISRHVAASFDSGAQVLFPQIEVSVAGGNPQRGGRPALMTTFTMEAWL